MSRPKLIKVDDSHWTMEDNSLKFSMEMLTHPKNIYNIFSATIFDTYLEKHIMNITGFESLQDIEKYCLAFADGYDYGSSNYSKED